MTITSVLLNYFLFQTLSYEELVEKVRELEKYYGLSRDNKLGYLKLRDYFNSYQDPVALFTLICYSFNNMTRFNKKGLFNVPFGKRIFNENIKKNLKETINAIQSKDIVFTCSDYKDVLEVLEQRLDENSFVYCDPPYLVTDAAYNSQWDKQEFTKLLILLDQLNERGIKWGLSEVIFHKGKENDVLREWMDTSHPVCGILDIRLFKLFERKKNVKVFTEKERISRASSWLGKTKEIKKAEKKSNGRTVPWSVNYE